MPIIPFASRKHKKEQTICQRRFWEHRIRNEWDFENHVDYIHYNPVKHGYASRPSDLPEGHKGRTAASIVTSAKEFCRPIGADRPSRCRIISVTNKHRRLQLATANPTLSKVMLGCRKAGNPTYGAFCRKA